LYRRPNLILVNTDGYFVKIYLTRFGEKLVFYKIPFGITLYGVSSKTMRTWLEPFRDALGEKKTYIFTVKQVNIVFAKIGKPKYYDLKEMKMAG
jgi:hypothetical protein